MTVNGTATTVQPNDTFSYALPLSAEGNTVVTVIATDNADNTTTIIRTINYDITPISFTVSEPPDNSQTNSTPLTVAGTVGETGGIIEIKNTTSDTTATDVTVNGTKFTGTIPLDTGSNVILVTVTDPAGNKQVVLRTVLYDPNALSIAITDPAHDIQLHTTTYLLKGTVSGSPSTVNLTFNGQPFTPAVTAGAFEQTITIPAEGSYQAVASIGTPPSYAVRNIIYTALPGDVDASGSITTLPDILTASQAAFGQITLDSNTNAPA